MSNRRRSRRQRLDKEASKSGFRGALGVRSTALFFLWAGPIFLIGISFLFGVGLQALGLIPDAKQGGLLGGLGGIAITVLIAAFICLPGYLVGIIWYGLKYKAYSFDAEKIKQGLLFIPLVAMTMAWVPAILVPNTGIGLRLQIAGFSLVLTLLFGYIWIAIVRLFIAVFSRIELIKE